MKKRVQLIFIVCLFFTVSAVSGYGLSSSEKDYRILKNAFNNKSKVGQKSGVSYFKVLVTGNDTKKVMLKITIPVSVIDWLSECVDDDFRVNDCQIDLKKVLSDLKKNGPLTLIEIYRVEKTVKIWFE